MRPSHFFLVLLLLQVYLTIQKTASTSPKKTSFAGHHLIKENLKKLLSSKSKNTNCECGLRKPSFGIINGQRTVRGEYPWQVSLQEANGDHICGGSIIHDDWVLTANHCPVHEGEKVVAGTNNLRRRRHQQIRTIQKVIGFHNTSMIYEYDDIKVVQVDRSFDFDDYVRPICLPFNLEDETFENERVEASGFGMFLRRGYGISSPILYKLYQTILSNSECERRIDHTTVLDSNICSEAENVNGMCYGDSGGPLVYEIEPNRFTLVGVVSFGERMQCYNTTAYARTTSYLDWVVENTGISSFCKPF